MAQVSQIHLEFLGDAINVNLFAMLCKSTFLSHNFPEPAPCSTPGLVFLLQSKLWHLWVQMPSPLLEILERGKFCICIFYKSGRSVPNIILIMSGWKVHESHLLHSLLLYVSFQHILQYN